MNKILYFVGGVVVGSAATFLIMRNLTEQRIQEEVEDFKKEYRDAQETKKPEKIEVRKPGIDPSEIARINNQKKQDLITNSNIVQKQNYNLFSKPPKAKDIHNGIDEDEDLEVTIHDDYPRDDLAEKPYTITPDQFVSENPFYDKVTLEYFTDGTLSEALSESIVEDIDQVIGLKSLEKFGEYEEDVVYVRNERRSTDYEVIMQHRPFAILEEDEY